MTLRHYGIFKNEEVIVLGYRKLMNTVMICRSTMLPADEQAQLRQIASSSYAQSKCDYLIPILRNERHKSGNDWFTYLANRLHRNDGSVSVLPLKEIDGMEPDQKAFLKGWGKSVSDVTEARQKGTPPPVDPEEKLDGYTPMAPLQKTVLPGEAPETAVDVPQITSEEAKPYVDRDAMMIQLMQQMVQGQKQIADGLATLESKVAKPARKKAATRKKAAPRKKAVAAKVPTQAPEDNAQSITTEG